MILNGRMFKFSVPTPGDHRSPLRTDGVSCAKNKPIKVNLNAKSQFVGLSTKSVHALASPMGEVARSAGEGSRDCPKSTEFVA